MGRKLAIARIEREAREREEAEQAKNIADQQRSDQGSVHRPETGDLESLSKYEKSWHTKISLHGIDGVRTQISKEMGQTNQPSMYPNSQPSHPSGQSFNPP